MPNPEHPPRRLGWWTVLGIVLRHRLASPRRYARALPAAALARLGARVHASEQRHSGQIRVAIETALPGAALWALIRQRRPLAPLIRSRAIDVFAQLRVWDTERNNGVLIYLLLAERAIEIVADRGIARCVPPHAWQAIVDRLRHALQQGRFEAGLAQAIDDVSALLERHFPRREADAPAQDWPNELPDAPVRLDGPPSA